MARQVSINPKYYTVSVTKSFAALTGGGTKEVQLFKVVGSVYVPSGFLDGIVQVALGNHTAAYFRLNDGTNTADLTAAAGTALTSFTAGSRVAKDNSIATAVTGMNASQCRAGNVTITTGDLMVTQKNGANTFINYLFTTTDDPAQGSIRFSITYSPRSADGKIIPA